ncbi:hypothetical protein GCM10010381_54780 [Streptomyces xantholiticus]|nr:hypothetical protein GCM10010381_54780 [Streptomyces xantholiticus]
MTQAADVVVIGGGPSGLAAGCHLRRLGVDFVILDVQATPGGAWQHTWDSLPPPSSVSAAPPVTPPVGSRRCCGFDLQADLLVHVRGMSILRISRPAERSGVRPSTLRFYESAGPLPARNAPCRSGSRPSARSSRTT